jgi:hypothetical protein
LNSIVLASALNDAAPFLAFGAFLLLFMAQARRRGQSVSQYLTERNRGTFTNLRPGWWKVPVAFSVLAWTALWIASGFKRIALAVLPLVVLWIPFWGLVLRAYFRRR